MSDNVDDFLEHFGVRGMRWGQRKDRSSQGRADKAARYADRRPTRGNIRSAQRLQRQANRRAGVPGWDRPANDAEVRRAVSEALQSGGSRQVSGLSQSPAVSRGQSAANSQLRVLGSTPVSRSSRGVPGWDRPATASEVARAVEEARRSGLLD